ncbi:unnamed protein product, partial [Adineta ricciae]
MVFLSIYTVKKTRLIAHLLFRRADEKSIARRPYTDWSDDVAEWCRRSAQRVLHLTHNQHASQKTNPIKWFVPTDAHPTGHHENHPNYSILSIIDTNLLTNNLSNPLDSIRLPLRRLNMYEPEQPRSVISSIRISLPDPPGAFEIIRRLTVVVEAINEIPYFLHVMVLSSGMSPVVSLA